MLVASSAGQQVMRATSGRTKPASALPKTILSLARRVRSTITPGKQLEQAGRRLGDVFDQTLGERPGHQHRGEVDRDRRVKHVAGRIVDQAGQANEPDGAREGAEDGEHEGCKAASRWGRETLLPTDDQWRTRGNLPVPSVDGGGDLDVGDGRGLFRKLASLGGGRIEAEHRLPWKSFSMPSWMLQLGTCFCVYENSKLGGFSSKTAWSTKIFLE